MTTLTLVLIDISNRVVVRDCQAKFNRIKCFTIEWRSRILAIAAVPRHCSNDFR